MQKLSQCKIMNYQKRFKITILFTVLIFLGGCAYFQKPPAFKHVPWQERKVELQQIADWTIAGALSITHHKKRDIAHFTWVQKQNSYTINIFGPLNIKSVRIVGDANGVEFWHTHKKCTRARTPEQLTLAQLGWELPISNMRYWIVALPAPNTKITATNFDQYGHLISLHQSGWQIKYSEFKLDIAKNIELPKIIELTSKELAVKIKITN
jgi:outer membrane lipoprotein LolB